MSRPVIISCALAGGGDTTARSPHVPVTPERIASEALAARAAGAAIVHIHVRDPYLSRGQLAPGNAPMVERAVRIIRELNAEVATLAPAREILHIG